MADLIRPVRPEMPFFPPDLLYAANNTAGVGSSSQEYPRPRIVAAVAKTVTLCNISCLYCYEYKGPDQSWRRQPRIMSQEIIRTLGEQVGRYASMHSLPDFEVVFHGGEPLLAGADYYDEAAANLRSTVAMHAPETRLGLSMQTNGMLLDEEALDAMSRNGITLSISLDGYREAHDANRVDSRGRGTYDRVRRGIELVNQPKYRHLLSGLLAVIDLKTWPLDVYEELISYKTPSIDFMLPYANWDKLPPLLSDFDNAPYGQWLIRIFDRWCNDQQQVEAATGQPKTTTDIRFFSSIISLLLGRGSSTEAIGPYNGGQVVLRPDGSYELVDALKMAADGVIKTPMDVSRHSLDEVEKFMLQAKQLGRKSLAAYCKGCPYGLTNVCGGGHIATRYSVAKNFDNPSVFCPDLELIINHIRHYVDSRLISAQQKVLTQAGHQHRTIGADANPQSSSLPATCLACEHYTNIVCPGGDADCTILQNSPAWHTGHKQNYPV